MSGAGVMRVKKLKGNGIITVAARHNRRVIQAEMGAKGSIDPARSHLNETLTGPSTAADVGQLAKDLMTAAGVVKTRKGAVMGLEIVFSLPPGHAIDDRAYFTACSDWAVGRVGGVILSVDIHRDEAQAHCHVLLLPLVNGRMNGSDMIGGKQKLMELQKDFHVVVASKFGLTKAPARLSGTAKQAAAKAVLQHLRDTADPALKSPGWPAYRDAIEAAPESFLLAYGLELATPKRKLRTLTQIMTSKGKGSASESNPIGKAPPKKNLSLCSVGFTPKAPPQPAPKAPAQRPHDDTAKAAQARPLIDQSNEDGEIAPPAPHDLPNEIGVVDDGFVETTTRHHDCDQAPDRFHNGDYCATQPPPARHKRQAADGWVNAALVVSNSKVTARFF